MQQLLFAASYNALHSGGATSNATTFLITADKGFLLPQIMQTAFLPLPIM